MSSAGGEPLGGPARQVVGLVHQHDLLRGVLRVGEEPLQGGVGGEHVVVVADHHVGPPGRVQGQFERAQQVLVGLGGHRGGVGAAQVRQGLPGPAGLQAVVVEIGPRAHLRAAVHLLLGADLLLGPDGHRTHRVALLPHPPDAVLGHRVLAVAGGAVEHPLVQVQGPAQGRVQDGGGLAQAGGGLQQQPAALVQGRVHLGRQLGLARARVREREGQGRRQGLALGGPGLGLEVGLVVLRQPGLDPGRERLGVEGQFQEGLGLVQERRDAQPAGGRDAGVPPQDPGVHPRLQGERVLRVGRHRLEQGRRTQAGLDFLDGGRVPGQQQVHPAPHQAGEAWPLQPGPHRHLGPVAGVRLQGPLLDAGVEPRPQGQGVLLGEGGHAGVDAAGRLQGRHERPHREAQGHLFGFGLGHGIPRTAGSRRRRRRPSPPPAGPRRPTGCGRSGGSACPSAGSCAGPRS